MPLCDCIDLLSQHDCLEDAVGSCACCHSWVCLSQQELDCLRTHQKLVLRSASMYGIMHCCHLSKQGMCLGANANVGAVILWLWVALS